MNKCKKIALIAGILMLSNSMLAIKNELLPAPYNSIDILAPDYHGWFREVNANRLRDLINSLKPKIVVEVGSWLGISAIYMARLIDAESRLYAIDHWQGSIEHRLDKEYSIKLPTLYQQFLSNVIHAGAANTIIPIKMSSLEAAKSLSLKPHLVYIDGSHKEEDVYNDIIAWYHKLEVGGVICGDDYFWGNEAIGGFVYNGVNKAARTLGVQVSVDENVFWQFPPKQ